MEGVAFDTWPCLVVAWLALAAVMGCEDVTVTIMHLEYESLFMRIE